MCRLFFFLLLVLGIYKLSATTRVKFFEKNVNKRALQKSHEKTREEKWSDAFIDSETFEQQNSLVNLIHQLSQEYLSGCSSVILYDNSVNDVFLSRLLKDIPITFSHGKISEKYVTEHKNLLQSNMVCVNFIIFLKDVMRCKNVIGEKNGKVIIIASSSQWRVQEFLATEIAQDYDNLLVIVKSDKTIIGKQESPYILYTHKLFVDALGSSQPRVLTSWILDRFTRNVNLFPKKIVKGFSGHRFIISVAHQPPFVIKKGKDENDQGSFDGREIRLIDILAKNYNFTSEFREASDDKYVGSGNAVAKTVRLNEANMGLGGLYVSYDRMYKSGIFQWHSQDCAGFVSLTSTALPRYRAIMGPFHWGVWLAIIITYLGAILLFELSDKLTLKHLIHNPEKIENMFWYVFGTFTNCFTFTGKSSWSRAHNAATKQLLGFFWLFTIIITACYTGSIVAFITIPIFPESVETIDQLLTSRYQIGLLDKGGWETWFQNLTDAKSTKLLSKAEYIPNVELGLKNVTKAFFWPYSFLSSRDHLNFIIRTNFSTMSKRSLLHISDQCFALFNVGILFPKKSIYADLISKGVLRVVETGLMIKIKNDVEWQSMRTATGKRFAANAKSGGLRALSYEDRSLTLDDTQGMFLLLAIGFTMGGAALLSEWFGGCFNLCKGRKRPNTASTLKSNPRSHERQTPRDAYDYYKFRRSFESEKRNSVGEGLVQNHCDGTETIIQNNNATVSSEDSDSDIDFNEEINRIFENVFGEENTSIDESKSQEILETNELTVEPSEATTSKSA